MDQEKKSSWPFTKAIILILLIVFFLYLFFPQMAKYLNKPASNEGEFFVYFNNENLQGRGPLDCEKVFPVKRKVSFAAGREMAILNELLMGPNEGEMDVGFSSPFSKKTEGIVTSVKVVRGVAHVDIEDIRENLNNLNASCSSVSFMESIKSTLMQFPNISNVYFTINGSPKNFYEWMQLDTPYQTR